MNKPVSKTIYFSAFIVVTGGLWFFQNCSSRPLPNHQNLALAAPFIVGDCDLSGSIMGNEITLVENIFADTAALASCSSADANGDGQLSPTEKALVDYNFSHDINFDEDPYLGFWGPVQGPVFLIADCDGDAEVTVDEQISASQILTGDAPLSQCLAVDINGDGVVNASDISSTLSPHLEDIDSVTPMGVIDVMDLAVQSSFNGVDQNRVMPYRQIRP